jgi:hypothetical protein
MNRKEKQKKVKKEKKFSISTALYIAAAVVAIIGIALLVNNIYLFNYTVAQYVSQGYSATAVRKSLLLTQLLPGITQPAALYGGIAFMLFAVGKMNKNILKYFMTSNKAEESVNDVKEIIIENDAMENTEQQSLPEQIDKTEKQEIDELTVEVAE